MYSIDLLQPKCHVPCEVEACSQVFETNIACPTFKCHRRDSDRSEASSTAGAYWLIYFIIAVAIIALSNFNSYLF